MAAQLAAAAGVVPDRVNGKQIKGCVRRGVLTRMRITAIPHDNEVKGLDKPWQVFELLRFVQGKVVEKVGYAIRNRETGVFYIYQ